MSENTCGGRHIARLATAASLIGITLVPRIAIAQPTGKSERAVDAKKACSRARSATGSAPTLAITHLYTSICLAASTGERLSVMQSRLDVLEKKLADYTALTISTDPMVQRAVGYVDTLGDIRFALPFTVRLPRGVHRISVVAPGHHGSSTQVSLTSPDDDELTLTLDPLPAARIEDQVDFTDEGEAGSITTSEDLPSVEHDELMPERFRRGGVTEAGKAPPSSVTVGALAGVNVSTRTGMAGAGGRAGFAASATVDYRLRTHAVVHAELGYASRGADAARTDYITLPVLGAYRVRAKYVALQVGAGPSVAIAIAKDDDNTTAIELGAEAAVSLRIPTSIGSMVVQFAMHLGLNRASTSSGSGRNMSSALRVGASF